MQIWSDKKSHSLLVEIRNGTTSSEYSWVVSYETKHNLTISSSNHAPWNLPKEVENLCPHKKLHIDVYINSSFIHNFSNLDTVWMYNSLLIHLSTEGHLDHF